HPPRPGRRRRGDRGARRDRRSAGDQAARAAGRRHAHRRAIRGWWRGDVRGEPRRAGDRGDRAAPELRGRRRGRRVNFGDPLTAAEAAMFEDSVVPRYLSFFGGLVADMLIPSPVAQIAHIACRTGYPDPIVAEKMSRSVLVGVDASAAALDMA